MLQAISNRKMRGADPGKDATDHPNTEDVNKHADGDKSNYIFG